MGELEYLKACNLPYAGDNVEQPIKGSMCIFRTELPVYWNDDFTKKGFCKNDDSCECSDKIFLTS